jgi:hypothetical protein
MVSISRRDLTGRRIEVAMLFRQLRRLALLAAVFPFVAGCVAHQSAGHDDAAQKAHESVVLDRIFNNAKARHDRVHSLHFTWDCRSTYKEGAEDPLSTGRRRARFEREQIFVQLGEQFYLDGDDRWSLVSTPIFKVPQAKLTDTRRVVSRQVVVGKTRSAYVVGSFFETGAAAPRAPGPSGTLEPSSTADEHLPQPSLQALFLTFRPQDPSVSWLKEQCRLVDENAHIDNSSYVEFEREMQGRNPFPWRHEACWADPERDDVVVHWTMQTRFFRPLGEASIKYIKDKSYGWIPSEWSNRWGLELHECKVTRYAINEKIDPATFSQEFPAGTPVEDRTDPTSTNFRYYVVQQDGSRRVISHDDYYRATGFLPPEKQASAKPQAK